MSQQRSPPSSRVVAELGPTNTGKTHRAIERLLEHETGMMGLPLRLLAREVYDRVTARVGERRVALVTGEERRVPPRPDYWICTVESMPTDREVDFLAVDEIQLAAHRERGHIFTDRLLHARGRKETWFLGSETIRPLLSQLIPGAHFQRATRLSQLRFFGRKSLKALPPRSAVIAFSVERVYELAERLRLLRGGVAVVLGALSPRTRNAQVAMYQAGEVQYLVATDAIGMGLNLALDHVAFAALSKFDGAEQRDLRPDELAQIAGRAGRNTNDGDFGTLNPLPDLSPEVASAIESHRFSPLRRLVWRNPTLDFTHPEALLESLARPPQHAAFSRVERADDFDALKALSGLQQIRELAPGGAALQQLWEVCQIPDFRKGLLGQHVALLREVFLQLAAGDGLLRDDWLSDQVAPLENLTGDIHTLTDRLAAIRVWTYISQRSRWLRHAEQWQERTQRIEDELGDALHERLVERFVERTARSTRRSFRSSTAAPDPSNPFAKLGSLLAPETALSEEQFVQRLVDASHAAFQVDRLGRISFDGHPIARLVRGDNVRVPQLALVEPELWTAGARRRIERRLLALVRDLVAEALGGLRAEVITGNDSPPALRGLGYRLLEGLGLAPRAEALEQWRLLDDGSRQRLAALGVREGHRFVYVAQALTPRALERRCLLVSLFHNAPPGAPAELVLPVSAFGGSDVRAFGYEAFGQLALRVDLVERLSGARGDLKDLLQQLGIVGEPAAQLLRALPSAAAPKRRRRRARRRANPDPPRREEVEPEEDGVDAALRRRLL